MFITVIQITAQEAIIARFKKQRGALEFAEGARHLLEETTFAEILSNWRVKCSGDRIILAIPPSLFNMREVDLPLTDRKKAREILSLELKGDTAVESDELVFEAILLAEGKGLAVWSRTGKLSPLISELAENGLDPEVVTSSFFCWSQLLEQNATGIRALLDNEAIALFRDGSPLYFRALPHNGKNRISATLAALELGKGITAERLTAVGSLLPEEEDLSVSWLQADGPFSAAFNGDAVAARDLATSYAAAAALLAGDPVNFRRGSLAFTRHRSELQRKLKLTGALICVALMLLFSEAALRYRLISRDLSSLDSSILKIYSQAFPKRTKPVDEVAELRAEIKRMGATTADGVMTPLRNLAEAKSEELNELYEIDIEPGQVSGKGVSRTVQGVNDFRQKAAAFFTAVEVSEIKSRPDGSTGFSFHAGMKGGAK